MTGAWFTMYLFPMGKGTDPGLQRPHEIRDRGRPELQCQPGTVSKGIS